LLSDTVVAAGQNQKQLTVRADRRGDRLAKGVVGPGAKAGVEVESDRVGYSIRRDARPIRKIDRLGGPRQRGSKQQEVFRHSSGLEHTLSALQSGCSLVTKCVPRPMEWQLRNRMD